MGRKFKWTVEIEVDETWVADGFDLNDYRVQMMVMEAYLGFATPDEVGGRVLKAPDPVAIAKAQGYASVEEWEATNRAGV